MWAYLRGDIRGDGIVWRFDKRDTCFEDESPNGVRISVGFVWERELPGTRFAMATIAKAVNADKFSNWLTPGKPTWTINLDGLRQSLPSADGFEFLTGLSTVTPELEIEAEQPDGEHLYYDVNVKLFITPFWLNFPMSTIMAPSSVSESLLRFQADHPDPSKAAFIMMRLARTDAHDKIVKAIRNELRKHGISGLRADDKEYHDDLLPNVQTYMHGCGFGVAVFERIESEEFNPNVGLEVGYMMAIGKRVCLLKDRTLKALQTDLVGRLYKQFDVLNPEDTIPKQIEAWIQDRDLVGHPQKTYGVIGPPSM